MEPNAQNDDHWMTFDIFFQTERSHTLPGKDLEMRLAQVWVSGERYRTVGPLVAFCWSLLALPYSD